ncbi:polyphosphate polymerase domain-containing protein [Parablautia sp. Marseille-Q6255]|uniref:polyphosphate polymerase domain-containing protein n=1 Tax=Parablautia sp. Marseille-Q6255 TaxID=3039593 RepID=UPI0024BC7105|nr:polyphosphate polymerase domain-containing protein [Parablautia sp. Marseille-Q6255]
MAQTVFNRYEKKYLMPEEIYQELRYRLQPYMQEDAYGLHTICNIYYDTPDSYLIRHSIEHPAYKEKLRLRSYGIPTLDSTVFLEIKKKYHKIVNKRRIQLTLQEAYDYVEHGMRPQQDSQILHEIDFFLHRYPLERGLYLAYDRIALFGRENHDFRITFDQNIRSRHTAMGLENGDCGQLLLPKGYYLMESKVMGATPLWFTEILSELSIYPVSFSKYGNIYKKEHQAFHFDDMMVHRMENWNKIRREEVC